VNREVDAATPVSFTVDVEPKVLAWARTSLNLSSDAVAADVGVTTSTLALWEAGVARPRLTQLRSLSKALHRTVATLLLPEPPPKPRKPRDYRTLPTRHQYPLGPSTLLAIRRAYRVADLANVLTDELGVEPSPVLPRLDKGTDAESAAVLIRDILGLTVVDQARAAKKHTAYHLWRLSVERHGVFVLEAPMPRPECRGFSIHDPLAPVITLTNQDFAAPRAFSLLHEFAHLSLHTSGLCEIESPEGISLPRIEAYCNHVAGAVMVPQAELLAHPLVGGHTSELWDDDTLEGIGASFKASKEVVLRRLLLFGRTTQAFYQSRRDQWIADHETMPDFVPRITQSRRAFNRNGVRFTGLVLEAQRAGVISSHEAADFLGTKAKYLATIDRHLSDRLTLQ
jgi:Zn-dependent peptidase ImmA (M78 family)/transcriptional regulator with XRE-family HTH domain